MRKRALPRKKLNPTLPKAAPDRLKSGEGLFRRLIENIRGGYFFYSHDPEGFFYYVSPSVKDILGYSQQEFLTHFSEYLTEECKGDVEEKTQRSLKGQFQAPYQVEVLTKSQEVRTLLVSEVPAFDSEGRVIAVDGVAQDVTQQKQAEETERYLAAIVESSDDAIIGGTVEGTIVSWNPGARRLFGYTAEEAVGRHISLIYPGNSQDFFDKGRLVMLRGEKLRDSDTVRLAKDGREIPVSVSINPIRSGKGEIIGGAGIIRDISDSKQAKEALKKAHDELEQRVEERTAELSRINESLKKEISLRKSVELELRARDERIRAMGTELSLAEQRERKRIANSLHDSLGQVLAVIRMQVAALRKRVSGGDTGASLEEIHRSLGEALEQTRSLVFELSPPILNELGLRAALESLCSHMHQGTGLTIEFEGAGGREGLGFDQSAFLFQAVRELLVNVLKHAQASRVRVELVSGPDDLRITVEDDGIGTGENVSRSEGFGLFNIRERLASLGGSLVMDSEINRGTRATIRMPRVDSPVADEVAIP